MARIRTIKPEFFKHEGLAELSIAHRMLFQGLWILADGYGRLEDRPKRIKIEIFPWDDLDINQMLEDLHQSGFIVRYEVDGVNLIEIPNFKKHQRITGKEAETPSQFPAPSPEKQSGNNGETPVDSPMSRKRKGKEEREKNTHADDGASAEEIFLTIEAKDKSIFRLPKSKVEQWKTVLPGRDVEGELRKAAQWHIEAPAYKKKTSTGMPKFLYGWLTNSRQVRATTEALPAPTSQQSSPDRTAEVAEIQKRRLILQGLFKLGKTRDEAAALAESLPSHELDGTLDAIRRQLEGKSNGVA